MASVGGCKRYKCEAILQLDSGVLLLTAQVPNIQFETSGPLLATVHFSDVGHLDLAHLAWPLQEGARDTKEGARDTNVRLYCSKTQECLY